MRTTNFGLVAIGIFKLVKCAALVGLGIGAIRLHDHDSTHVIAQWKRWLPIGPPEPHFDQLVARLFSLDDRTLHHIAAGLFVYAALFLVEGIGLCLRRRWAELMTIGITASLLPLEVYEIAEKPTMTRTIVMTLNLAIMGYLIVQVARDRGR